MSVSEYASWWRQHKAGEDERLLYLKDWHFANEIPGFQVSALVWAACRALSTQACTSCVHDTSTKPEGLGYVVCSSLSVCCLAGVCYTCVLQG